MGLLAALAVPALKNLGKSNTQVSASRQLLDDIGRARQLAISQHTTVYMVFVPTNFFGTAFLNGLSTIAPAADQVAAYVAATNMLDKQLSGYNFISYGRVGGAKIPAAEPDADPANSRLAVGLRRTD